MSRTDLCHYLA